MKNVNITFVLLFATILFGCHHLDAKDARVRPASWAKPVINTPLENFYQVDDKLFRSSQPEHSDIASIQAMGIKSFVNLRQYHSDDHVAKGSDLQLMRVKMNAGELQQQQITEALADILKAEGPVLVHCWHGSDRTGAVVAAYRMVVEGWSKQAAIDEFINGGYGYHESWYPNIKTLLGELNVSQMREELKLENE